MKILFTYIVYLLCFLLFSFNANAQMQGLQVSNNTSDGIITATWKLNARTPALQAKPVYVQLYDSINNKEIYSKIIDSLMPLTWIEGTMDIPVKPNFTNKYRIFIYAYGTGTLLASTAAIAGQSRPMDLPVIDFARSNYENIRFFLINNSQYTDNINVYKNGLKVAVVKATQLPEYVANVGTEIVSGESYNYCFQGLNAASGDTTTRVCIAAASKAINFTVSKMAFANKVQLNWLMPDEEITEVTLLRDGVQLLKGAPGATSYTDLKPIPGFKHQYQLVLKNLDNNTATFIDSGWVQSIGKVSGFVLSNAANGSVGVANTVVKLSANILGNNVIYTTTTNNTGYYEFKQIYFHTQADYTLSFNRKNVKFTIENAVLNFTRKNYVFEANAEADIKLIEQERHPFAISNFKTNKSSSSGFMNLEWQVTTNDTVFFQLHRNQKLIKTTWASSNRIVNINDETGIPLTPYNYELRSYSLVGTRYYIKQNTVSDTFPNVLAVAANQYNVAANTTNATVDMSWQYPQGLCNGFFILRNGILIAQLDSSVRTFTDLEGANGATYSYGIVVSAKKQDGNLYQSLATIKTGITYPTLAVPTMVSATTTTDGFILINGGYTNNNAYNYTSVNILRNDGTKTDTVAKISKGLSIGFTDETGLPNATYTYSLIAQKNASYSQASNSSLAAYPAIPAPVSFSQGVKMEGFANLNINSGQTNPVYQIELSASGKPTQTYKIYENNVVFGFGNSYVSATTISCRLLKTINGNKYYSSALTTNYTSLNSSPYTLTAPTNFKASTNLIQQVQLSWSYPNFILPTFYIYRNGILLDSLSSSVRSYTDFSVDKTESYLYQIRAIQGSKKSTLVADYGNIISPYTVSGFISNKYTQNGIHNVLVQLIDNSKIIASTTSKNGKYFIQNIIPKIGMIIKVFATNAAFDESEKYFDFEIAPRHLTVNFTDTLPQIEKPSNSIASIQHLALQLNNTNSSVELNWSMSNGNYTGVEVNRSLQKIGILAKGQLMAVSDKDAVPGVNYSYRIRPYLDTEDDGTLYGNFVDSTITFPALLAPENLQLTASNDAIKLTWSHAANNHTYYEIKRNGKYMGKVLTQNAMQWTDNTGVPGLNYKYEVTSVLEAANDVYFSDAAASSILFPTVSAAQKLTVSNQAPGRPSTDKLTYSVILRWWNSSTEAKKAIVQVNGKTEKTMPITYGWNQTYSTASIPNANNTFSIIQIVNRGIEYNSKPLSESFTTLPLGTNLIVSPNNDLTNTFVNVIYRFNAWDTIGLDSAELVLNQNRFSIADVISINKSSKRLFPDTMSDKNMVPFKTTFTNIPDVSYVYRVRGVSWRAGIRYTSAMPVDEPMNYPKLPDPINVANIDTTGMSIKLKWQHTRTDVDSFYIFNDNKLVGGVNGSTYTFTFVPEFECVRIKIIAVKKYGNVRKASLGNTPPLITSLPMALVKPCFPATAGAQFGRIVEVNANTMVVTNNTSNNEVYFYKKLNNGWVYESVVKRGSEVKVATLNDIVAVAYNDNKGSGIFTYVDLFHRVNGAWTLYQTLNSGRFPALGYNVAMHKDKLVISMSRCFVGGSPNTCIQLFQKNTNNNLFVSIASRDQQLISNEGIGETVALNDNTIVAGGPTFNPGGLSFQGAILVFNYTNNSISSSTLIGVPSPLNGMPNHQFGSALDISDDTLLVGSNNLNVYGNFNYVGGMFLYVRQAGTWTLRSTTHALGVAGNITGYLGHGVAIGKGVIVGSAPNTSASSFKGSLAFRPVNETGLNSNVTYSALPSSPNNAFSGYNISFDNNIFYTGAPNANSNTGMVQMFTYPPLFDNSLEVNEVSNLQASKADFDNKVILTWNYNSVGYTPTRYDIFRDGIKIDIAKTADRDYTDIAPIPAKRHVYTVVAIYTNAKGLKNSTIGFTKPIGEISGSVVTAQGNNPVEGVTVIAKAISAEATFTYTTTTDAFGNYEIKRINFGEEARIEVSVTYVGHQFLKPMQAITMDVNSNRQQLPNFVDITAYSIIAQLNQYNCNCPIDSVKVTLKTYIKNQATKVEEKITEVNGKAVFNVLPKTTDLLKFELLINNNVIKGNDTLWYQFDSSSFQINQPKNLGTTNLFVAENQLKYKANITTGSVCGSIGSNKYNIEITSKDGCFKEIITTNTTGSYLNNLELPPLDLSFKIIDVLPRNTNNSVIEDYFAVRPIVLPLGVQYLQQSKTMLTTALINEKVQFVYHQVPNIVLTNGLPRLCNSPTQPYYTHQNDKVNLSFNVSETFSGSNCAVFDGTLRMKNTGAENADDVIEMNEQGIVNYSFTAGAPAISAPYLKYIFAQYWNSADEFVAEIQIPVLITGSAAIPGSDFIIENDQNEAQWPLMVLRDPPGDLSFSYVEEGAENTLSATTESEAGGYGGTTIETGFKLFGIGTKVAFDAKVGGSNTNTKGYEIGVSTTRRVQSIANSSTINAQNTNYITGNNGDVIVGVGTTQKYGVTENISIEGCKVIKRTGINISQNGIATNWIYSIDYIKNLVRQYDSLINLANKGLVKIDNKDFYQTSQYYTARKKNWESILNYHEVETTPVYRLCDVKNYNRLFGNTNADPYQQEAEKWAKNCFCTAQGVGVYDGAGNFKFQKGNEISWDNNNLELFRKSRTMVDRYLQASTRSKAFNGKVPDRIKSDIEKNLIPYTNTNVNQLQLNAEERAVAENISFGGATTYDRDLTVSNTYSSSFTSNFYFESNLAIGFVAKTEVSYSAGGGLGFITLFNNTIAEIDHFFGLNVGVKVNLTQSSERTTTTTNSVGYHLEDDDAGDQFSVTAIKGIDRLHTPYFALVGGRSSCPNEPGTIARNNLALSFETPEGQGVNNVQRDLQPNTPAIFPLKMSNNAPLVLSENLDFNLSPSDGSNAFNAGITFNGSSANKFTIPSGGSAYTNIFVQRGAGFSYSDLSVYLGANCSNGTDEYGGATLDFEAYFRRPCSEISIVTPSNNWVINKANAADPNNTDESLRIDLADYDLNNPLLQSVELQYRRVGTNSWNNITQISKVTLDAFYNINRLVFKNPQYPYVWQIKGNDNIVNGEYEIRAGANCGTGGITYSKNISGRIDRSTVQLFGIPQPADKLLSIGDEISVNFNKPILCGLIDTSKYTFVNKATMQKLNVSAVCNGSKIIFTINQPMASLDGVSVLATLQSAEDIFGNTLESPVVWEFDISNNPLFYSPNAIAIEVYKGTKTQVNLSLINNSIANHTIVNSGLAIPLLSTTNGNINISSIGAQIPVNINTSSSNLGIFLDTLVTEIVSSTGFSKLLVPIKVNVLALPPNWQVNAGNFSGSASIICNYNLDSTEVLSADTMDKIAVLIDGEIRGFSNIIKTGNFYRAYIAVFGNSSDNNKPLHFRVWHAKKGIQYDAKSRDNMTFALNAFYGTTPSPRILDISTVSDSLRFIALQAGWNWVAFNTQKTDASVSSYLQNLTQRTDARIKTLSNETYWNNATGEWIELSNGVGNINTANGYMVYVKAADTLYISGKPAEQSQFTLKSGWNLIGNTIQTNTPINNELVSTAISNKAVIKGRLSNPVQIGDFDSINKRWNGISTLLVNQAYMLRNSKAGSIFRSTLPDTSCEFEINKYEYNTTFFATIQLDGMPVNSSNFYVAAYSGNSCRGTAQLEYSSSLKQYVMSLFVYSNTLAGELNFKIYDKQNNRWYAVPNKQNFDVNKNFGSPQNPYIFSNQQVTNIASVNSNEMKLMAYPNPFENKLKIDVNTTLSSNATITLIDVQGKQIVQQNEQLQVGKNTIMLNQLNSLTAGLYLLQINQNGKISSIKLMKY